MNEPQTNNPEPKTNEVVVSKDEFAKMQEAIKSFEGLAELVKTQSETISALKDQVTTTASRAENIQASVSNTYIKPAQIASGEWPYIKTKIKVNYRQATINGVITEKEQKFDVEMPKPCGKLNSVMSELKGRVIPRLMKEKGISDYQVADVSMVTEEEVTKKQVSFVGKECGLFDEKECQEFAIIYEELSVPPTGSLTAMRTQVAKGWGYVMHDCPRDKQLVIDNKIVDKSKQKVRLVDYKGVRQKRPKLEAYTPSEFREYAKSALEVSASETKSQ